LGAAKRRGIGRRNISAARIVRTGRSDHVGA
jgi:hypothetical protein